MKKYLWCLMAFATLVMIGCKKDGGNDPKDPDGGDDPDPVVETLITVDGDFSDWDAIANNPDLATAIMPETSKFEYLYAMKFITDPDYIYFYLEFSADTYTTAEGATGNMVDPIDIYMNVDGDESTGSNSYLWENSAADYLIEGFWNDNFATASVNSFPADADQTEWAWVDAGVEAAASTSDRVILAANGHAAIEGQIIRALIPSPMKALKVGVFTSNTDWAESGCLPATVLNENGTTTASPLLEVKLN